MLSIVKSMSLHGLDGFLVFIEVDISFGMPCFEIVGLPGTSVKESKERVRTAIRNSNIEFLSRKIVVNLAPANTRKEGSNFDLAIAVGILIANGNIVNNNLKDILKDTIFIGELSLNGKVEKIEGILPICIEARQMGAKRIIVPKENSKEASIVDGIEILPAENLLEVINYLNGNITINSLKSCNFIYNNKEKYKFDFGEVKGQEHVKRALEVAAAGGHNCLLIRKPWSRKNYAC